MTCALPSWTTDKMEVIPFKHKMWFNKFGCLVSLMDWLKRKDLILYYTNRKKKSTSSWKSWKRRITNHSFLLCWKYSVTWNCLHDFQLSGLSKSCNPLHLHIIMSILHTVLYTFPKVRTRRICLTIKSFFGCWSFPLFSWPWCLIQGNIVRRN